MAAKQRQVRTRQQAKALYAAWQATSVARVEAMDDEPLYAELATISERLWTLYQATGFAAH